MTLFQSTGAKRGRELGTETVTKGVPGPPDPRSMHPPLPKLPTQDPGELPQVSAI